MFKAEYWMWASIRGRKGVKIQTMKVKGVLANSCRWHYPTWPAAGWAAVKFDHIIEVPRKFRIYVIEFYQLVFIQHQYVFICPMQYLSMIRANWDIELCPPSPQCWPVHSCALEGKRWEEDNATSYGWIVTRRTRRTGLGTWVASLL